MGAVQAVVGAILAEWMAGKQGLGYLMTFATATYKTPLLFGAVIVTALLGIAVYQIIDFLTTFAIKSGETSALNFNGKRYMALEVFGTSDTELTDIIGLRFFNETHPEGVVIDTFSLGGYSASWFLRDFTNTGDMFAAFGFQAAIIHYGANTNGRSTPEQFKADISDVVVTRQRMGR